MIPLSKITGKDLVEAYTLLNPEEADFMAPMVRPFQAWLNALRAGRVEHQLSLNDSFTGKKTRALLLILDINPPPQTIDELIYMAGIKPLTEIDIMRENMRRRHRRMGIGLGRPEGLDGGK